MKAAKAALDVHYDGDRAVAACVVFRAWADSVASEVVCATVPHAAPYRAGRFYERELPCLLAVLEKAGREFGTLIIDGYVHLRPEVGKGLGTHLHGSLSYRPAVIGVAKRPLKVADRFLPVIRGRSSKPLYVSALGCPLERAARAIASMHGRYRIPTLLKITDRAARAGIASP
jgi:deoxyribonuclease V